MYIVCMLYANNTQSITRLAYYLLCQPPQLRGIFLRVSFWYVCLSVARLAAENTSCAHINHHKKPSVRNYSGSNAVLNSYSLSYQSGCFLRGFFMPVLLSMVDLPPVLVIEPTLSPITISTQNLELLPSFFGVVYYPSV